MKVVVQLLLKTGEEGSISLPKKFQYNSPDRGLLVSIQNHDTDEDTFLISVETEAGDIESAKAIAVLEGDWISSVLSWRFGLIVKSVQVNSVQHQDTKGSNHNVVFVDTLYIRDHVRITRSLNQDNGQLLAGLLSGNSFGEKEDEFLYMWRQAIGEQSKVLRFLLLYRLLERLITQNGKNIHVWLREEDPTSQVISGDSYGRPISLYTDLRNEIHGPRTKDFPVSKIESHVGAFQNLVRKALVSFFPNLK